MRVPLLLLLAAPIGCGTGGAGPAVRWMAPPPPTAASPSRAPAQSTTASTKVTLAKWAAGHRTPQACEQAARYTIRSSATEALRRLRACVRRPDYDVLTPLVRSPWLKILKRAKGVGLDILAATIARRQEIAMDVGSAQAAGFALHALMKRGPMDAYVGRMVLAPGVVDKVAGTSVALRQMTYELPSYREDQYDDLVSIQMYGVRIANRRFVLVGVDVEKNGEARHLMTWYETDRTLRFAAPSRCRVKKDDTIMVLARLAKVTPYDSETGHQVARLKIVNCYPLPVSVDTGEAPPDS